MHWNPGTQLTGCINPIQDCIWQGFFCTLTAFLPQHYSIRRGTIADHFLDTYSNLIKGIVDCTHNSEKPFVFVMVLLQQKPHVNHNRDVKTLLDHRLDEWDAGHYESLVHSCEQAMSAFLPHCQGSTSNDQQACRFHHLILQGEVHRAVCYLTECKQFSVLQPSTPTGPNNETVLAILQDNHPFP